MGVRHPKRSNRYQIELRKDSNPVRRPSDPRFAMSHSSDSHARQSVLKLT